MFTRTILSALALFGLTNAQNPIPNRPDGFPLGGPTDAPIVLEAFFDLMCPDSRAAWPVVQQVVSHYGDNLHFRFHTFPLPYHTWSHVANQGAHYLGDNNATAAYAWMNAVFANQEAFGNSATAQFTRTQVLENFGSLAEKSGLTSTSLMVTGLNDPNQDWNTRVSWKYACSRAITGTPQFLVNGVQIQADPGWSAADWESVLDSLLPTPTTSSHPVKANKKLCSNKRKHKSATLIDGVQTCPAGQESCEYLPGKTQCCLAGENCIKNVGCRC